MRCMVRSLALLAGLFMMPGILLLGRSAHEEKSGAPRAQGASKQKAKRVYTNEDLKSLKNTTRVNQTPATASRPQNAGRQSAGIEGYRDTAGHNREYWQKKIRPLNNQLETLDSQIAAQQAKYDRLNAASGMKLSRSGKLSASSSDTRAQVAKRIDDLKQKRVEVLKSKEDLEEEARKAQALPEWLR
jgi:chromosome segregation ATPase